MARSNSTLFDRPKADCRRKRRWLAVLALTPAITACLEFDIGAAFGPWGGGGYYGQPKPELAASGYVRIGAYAAFFGEAEVLIYAPADTMTAIQSVTTGWGGIYEVGFGNEPAPEVCDYLARVVLWNGEGSSELKPLFSVPVDPCTGASGWQTGPDFDLPGYELLSEPFVITGNVWVNGTPIGLPGAQVELHVRLPEEEGLLPLRAVTDGGTYRFEITDRAQWFGLCHVASATVKLEGEGREHNVMLNQLPLEICVDGRRLPDVRVGTRKAAWGRVDRWTRLGPVPLTPDLGSARVALLHPADSTVLGKEQPLHDDGSFQLWFPQELTDPGCDWLIRAALDERASEIRPLLSDGSGCHEDLRHYFEFPG